MNTLVCFSTQSQICLIVQHPRVFIHCVRVCDLGCDCPVTVRPCCRERGDSQNDGHARRLLGLVCVCCHNNCQAAEAEAWCQQWLLCDSWAVRAALRSKIFGYKVERSQGGSIWRLCKYSKGWASAAPSATHYAPSINQKEPKEY